ncbi:OpgC domain-containing protein [Vibrio lamellibrachiae]|uniref:OpgC domain-containing protein n=1 Tax=Vibrio lamellibrachiae TaxID=2910253 RepID=UPI003D10CE69
MMKRNHAIDSVRGLLLLCMAINHYIWITGGWSVVQRLTLQPFGQVGAAEGFIFISGLMVGLIYCRPSAAQVTRSLFTRVKQLYSYHVASLILIIMLSFSLSYLWSIDPSFIHSMFPFLTRQPELATPLILLMIHKPAYFDILPMYIAFMLLAPLVITLLYRGKVVLIIAISLAMWLSSSWVDASFWAAQVAPLTPINTGYFSWLAWQLPFVIGIGLGYSHHHLSIQWFKYKSALIVTAIIATFIFLTHHNVFAQAFGIHQGTLYQLANKPTLGWLRVLNLAMLIYLISYVIHHKPHYLTFRPLALLGRHSLPVFAWHYVVIFTLAPLSRLFIQSATHYNLMLVAVALLLFIPPLIREKHLTIRRFTFNRST